MADPQLKLDVACPHCGASMAPGQTRCVVCFREVDPPRTSVGLAPCPSCGKTNLLSVTRCFECGEPMPGVAPSRPTNKRRKSLTLNWTVIVFWARAVSVIYLLWSVVDGDHWLMTATAGLPTGDPAALRLTVYALYELARNAVLVGAVWLLTSLRLRRSREG